MDIAKLRMDAGAIDWAPMEENATVDGKVRVFNDSIRNLYDKHAPVRKIKMKHAPAPWLTESIRMAMRRRDQTFRKFKKTRSESNWTIYKTARNRCNQMIRNAKRHHILQNISSSTPAFIWKFLRTLGVGNCQHTSTSATVGLDDMNRHFITSPLMSSQIKSQTLGYVTGLPRQNIEAFSFSPVASDEIKNTIVKITSKAVGCDEISRFMVITILDQILPAVCHIINFSLYSGQFPVEWRRAYVRPLPKIPDPSLPSHFRPISILPFLSKVLEACVHKQLSKYILHHDILSPFQSGFRPGHSTVTAMLKMTSDIRNGVENAKVTVLVLIDFTNAFNMIDHDILLAVLTHYMISSEALEWFSSYLRGRQQSVRIDETSSSWRDLAAGVPQGGILSPLLFSMFINLITLDLRCSYHLYADDLQIYLHTSLDDLTETVENINSNLEAIKNWSERFGVSVNPAKCQAIIVGSPSMIYRIDTPKLPPIVYNGSVIPMSSSVRDLGLLIDSNLTWKPYVGNVSQRVTAALRSLYRLKNFLPPTTKLMLVQALIFPIIDYCDVCYLDLNADLLNKLDRLLNNCIRFIFNLRKYDHVTSYRTQLSWLPIRQRRSLRALTTLHSLLNNPTAPTYLTSQLKLLCSNHDRELRSTNNLLLLCPKHSSSLVHSSFVVESILLWNALPLEIRKITNRITFKAKVREIYLKQLAEISS